MLVGDVLGISSTQVLVTVAAGAAIVVMVGVGFRPLLYASLDEEVAEARGVRVGAMSMLFLLVLALTASVTAPILGVLLTFALLVGPAATASLLAARPGRTVGLAVALSLVDVWVGLALSYWVDVPPSVFVTGLAFAGYLCARLWRSGVLRRGHGSTGRGAGT